MKFFTGVCTVLFLVIFSCKEVPLPEKNNNDTAVTDNKAAERVPAEIAARAKNVPAENTAKAGSAGQAILTKETSLKNISLISPISADLKTMLHYSHSRWRNSEYEIFTFNLYPSLFYLITESFAVQSKFLKRLAFFTEKPGFAGRLARDGEIAGLRDWFAHDYRAGDLAAFFELARRQNFPLNEHEILLRELLLAQGIIRNEGNRYAEGKGALLGFSVESRDRLPVYFAHETIHGLSFIMPELQKLFMDFFESLSITEKNFIRDALVYREYNVMEDRRLLALEMAAYLLQQPPEDTDKYFTEYIMGWYKAYHKGNIEPFSTFLKENPGIFGIRSAALRKEFEAMTGLKAEALFI